MSLTLHCIHKMYPFLCPFIEHMKKGYRCLSPDLHSGNTSQTQPFANLSLQNFHLPDNRSGETLTLKAHLLNVTNP